MANAELIWGTLGDRVYRASEAPDRFQFKQSTRYEEIGRIDQKPLLQGTGDDLNSLDLVFVFIAPNSNPAEMIKLLQDALTAREPMFLNTASGRFQGYYLITSIGVNVIDTLPTGEIINASVTVSFIETTDRPDGTPIETNPYVQVR